MRTARLMLLGFAACVPGPSPEPDPGLLEFEPGLGAPWAAKADVPNRAVTGRRLDTAPLGIMANQFALAGHDLRPSHSALRWAWPLATAPVALNRLGTPIRLGDVVYEHTGLDMLVGDGTAPADVRSPVTGYARLTNWYGEPLITPNYYAAMITLWDADSHHVIQLMHVKPLEALPRAGEFAVTAGQVLGSTAKPPAPQGYHVHVAIVDGSTMRMREPTHAFATYQDHTAPTVLDAYLLDAAGQAHTQLRDGTFDLVVRAIDRDDASPRNLEVATLAYALYDQTGRQLAALGPCDFTSYLHGVPFADGRPTRGPEFVARRLLDFDTRDQRGGFWPNSDLGNPDREFAYVLTHLFEQDGTCAVVATDADGQLTITPEISMLRLEVEARDHHGNVARRELRLLRP